jgi:hypothetical protein
MNCKTTLLSILSLAFCHIVMAETPKIKGVPDNIYSALPKTFSGALSDMGKAKTYPEFDGVLTKMLEKDMKFFMEQTVLVRIKVTDAKGASVSGCKVQLNELLDRNSFEFHPEEPVVLLKKMLVTDKDGKCSYDKIPAFHFYSFIIYLVNSRLPRENFNAIAKAKGYKPKTVKFLSMDRQTFAMGLKVFEFACKFEKQSGKPVKILENYTIPASYLNDAVEVNIVLEKQDTTKDPQTQQPEKTPVQNEKK